MKKIYLLMITMFLASLSFAQTYVINICGNVASSNGLTPQLQLDYVTNSTSSQLMMNTDANGDYCFTLTTMADSGAAVYFYSMSMTQMDCLFPTEMDTIQDMFITSDTTITINFEYCSPYGPASCGSSITNGPATVYEGETASFSAHEMSYAVPYTYTWDFGDGNTVTGTESQDNDFTTTHVYDSAGVYQACVDIIDATGCTSTACQNITVNALVCSTSITQTGNILSTNNTGVPPFAYAWNNGASASSIIVDSIGQYCLTVVDAVGCITSSCINVNSIPSYNVNVCGNVANNTGIPTDVNLTDLSNNSNVGTITTTTDSSGNYCFSYQVYGTAGTWFDFEITQPNCPNEIDSFNGAWITQDTSIIFNINYCDSVVACEVYFNDQQDSTGTGIVTYTATPYGGVAPYSYVWDFGDGSSGTGQTVTTMYQQTGVSYNVCVTMTDAAGCQSYFCEYILVDSIGSNIPVCDVLIYYELDSANNNTVYLYSYPNGVPPFTYSWYFSDGSFSTNPYPVHTYVQGQGWDWVCLDVVDATGCVASYCEYIELPVDSNSGNNAYCQADFMGYFDDISGVAGEVEFYDFSYSDGNIVSWEWNFGDGSSSTQQDPAHVYTNAGYYTVCLTTTDDQGCTSSMCQTCYIDPSWWNSNPWNLDGSSCVADFIAGQDSSAPGMVYLIDLSYGNNLYYTWDFGNGVIINDPYPFVNFTGNGVYEICLNVTDTLTGCSDTFCDSIGFDSNGSFVGKTGTWGLSVIPSPRPRSVTGVKELSVEETMKMTLYPNPANDETTIAITLDEFQKVNISITDLTGKVVNYTSVNMNNGINNYVIDTGALSKGMYLVNVSSDAFQTSSRLVVQH